MRSCKRFRRVQKWSKMLKVKGDQTASRGGGGGGETVLPGVAEYRSGGETHKGSGCWTARRGWGGVRDN